MKIGHLDMEAQVVVVAEIGNNHEGDPGLAAELIRRAADAGVDAVKFQTIVPERLISPAERARVDQLRRFQLSYAQFAKLADVARQHQVLFLSTPFDLDSARFLEPLVPAFKIASGDNNFLPLLDYVASTGKPILLSTGMAGLAEIEQRAAYITARWAAGRQPGLALLHCVARYPTPPEEANLLALEDLKLLGHTIGYSDHTLGIEAAVLSVALGARVIEKHFTLAHDHSAFRDHQLSADPAQMTDLVRRVRQASVLLGAGARRRSAGEADVAAAARRSIAAARDLPAGTVLGLDDLTWLRPASGLAPGREAEVIGRQVTRPLMRGEIIQLDDLAVQ